MEILLAREEITSKPKKAKLEKLLAILETDEEAIFYFDRDNSHKIIMEVVEKVEAQGYNVHFREVRYGLADEEYIYEVHALKN
jgi:hypothetical protein